MDAKATSQNEFNWFWTGMDSDIEASLSEDQKLAIANAIRKSDSGPRPSDIRLSLFGYFVVLISGKERRNTDRIAAEKSANPVVTWRNLPMLAVLWAALIYGTWGLLGFIIKLAFGA